MAVSRGNRKAECPVFPITPWSSSHLACNRGGCFDGALMEEEDGRSSWLLELALREDLISRLVPAAWHKGRAR